MTPYPTSVTQALCCLPDYVEAAGRSFSLRVFANYDPDDIRVAYVLDGEGADGTWPNPYAAGLRQSFLVLREGVATDEELIEALFEVRAWLVERGLLPAAFDLR